ncbi:MULTISPECIES: hypothetical protein [unclassified Imperialibacter]|uniref:hypothetical protein n=1 Tax=unclassified Imperialibacter TaxID=2629706 RepID=UPI001252ADC4|nr:MULTISPECIES: hypothetical protein [unclassified Imperialibacter]CAD5275710.1 conserved hypothetical protein [Imperialibacter sp. 75]CAD5293776.1 conserved hypothetical protein [Imperialibacter sp. 89]VVT12828.1 hypothetical protein IMPR6_20282 [Imperialibacter sp. EC-SDR9]
MNRFPALVLLLLAFSSCNRTLLTRNTPPCKFRLTQQALLLANKRWQEVSIEARRLSDGAMPNTKDFKDVTGQFNPSDLDDVAIFDAKGTYVFDEGPVKARPESPQVYEKGTWCICKGGSQLILTNGPAITVYDIIELKEQSLVLQLQRSNEDIADTYLLTYQPF